MINAITFIPFVSSLIVLFVLAYVVGQRKKQDVNRAFVLLLSDIFALTLLDFFLRVYSANPDATKLIMKCLGVSGAFSGVLFLNFMYLIAGKKRSSLFFFWFLLATICALFTTVPYGLIGKTIVLNGSPSPIGFIPSRAFFILFLASVLPEIHAVLLGITTYMRSTDKHIRRNLSFLFTGTFSAIVFYTIMTFPVPLLFKWYAGAQYSTFAFVIFALVLFRAISKHKFLSHDVEQIRRVSERLFAEMHDAVIVFDPDGIAIQTNDAAREFLGIREGTPVNKRMLEQMVPGYRFEEPFKNFRSTVRSENGERTIMMSQSNIGERDSSMGRICVIHDITAEHKAEQQIADSLSFIKMILDSSPVGILVYKMSGECVSANRAAARIVGGTVEQLLAQNFRDIETWKRNGLLEKAETALKSEKPVTGEIHHTSTFGKTAWFNTIMVAFSTDTGKNLLLLIEDVSDYKNAEENRFQLQQQLNKSQKLESLGLLAGGIAHDFNNLLCGIYGYLDMARSLTKDNKAVQYLDTTVATINRARSLTHQLLTFAKGGSPVQKITPLIPFLQETVQFALSGSNVSGRFSLADDLWLCNIDKNQIGQVIDNMVINAQQAMPDGGTIDVKAENIPSGEKERGLMKAGAYVKISIIDNGVGIPNEIMPRIFDPFYTTKTKGHGLGLATSYSIINRHGGCIDVVSEPGKGSSFHIYLPAITGNNVPVTDGAHKNHKGTGTILVMDDDKVVRDTIDVMLKSFGYSVVCTNDGKEALDYFNEAITTDQKIAGMILNITVPGGMGGKDTVGEIRKLDNKIPVFVASGYADDPVMKNPVDYGFTASVSKPFTIAEFSEMLEKHLKATA